jgi:hypothetical protein
VLTHHCPEYRSVLHHRSLESATAVIASRDFAIQREQVLAIWDATMTE